MTDPTPLRVGLWTETAWAFGRIARAIVKYAAPSVEVTIYDWHQPEMNKRLFEQQEWHNLDLIVSNSYLLSYYKQTYGVDLPPELRKKTAIIVHFPRFDMTHFSEHVYYLEGVHYAGVSKETCINLNTALGINNARWVPFGADTDEFSAALVPVQRIRRIGYVGQRRDESTEFAQNKGQAVFEEICRLVGAEPVFIYGRQDTASLYEGIDLLLCCSRLEAGPLGVFEAASCGMPVLIRRVGNAQEIEGIATFDNAPEAALRIVQWNDNLDQLASYRDRVTREVRQRWNMKTLVETHLVTWLQEIHAEPTSAAVEPSAEAPPAPVLRLHMLAVPHTITRSEFSHCAFTGKVLRFSPMMRSRGFEVYHYGVETSESGATVQVDLFTKAEWEEYRLASYKFLHPEKSIEQCREHFANDANFIGDLANYNTPLYEEFNRRLRIKLLLNYRNRATDLVCLPFGRAHQGAVSGLNVVTVESGIGYPDSFDDYRVFESYAWLHHELGMDKKQQCSNYWFVVPNYFDSLEWPLSLQPQGNTIGYFGRIYDNKGCGIVVEIAKRFPSVTFILCGQGDPAPYLRGSPNIVYKKPIHGKDRGTYLGSLCALLAPTVFIEPFCGVAVEAQLCGTPVMAPDYGAQTETIEQGRTGLRCHTLADYCLGVRLALEGRFDRNYIRERAAAKYDMYEVAKEYDYVFRSILDVHNGTNGWYSPTSHMPQAIPEQPAVQRALEPAAQHAIQEQPHIQLPLEPAAQQAIEEQPHIQLPLEPAAQQAIEEQPHIQLPLEPAYCQPKIAVIVILHTTPPFDRFCATWLEYAKWTETNFSNIRVYLALSREAATGALAEHRLPHGRLAYTDPACPHQVYSEVAENRMLALVEKTWNTIAFAIEDFQPDLLLRTNACSMWHWPRYLDFLKMQDISAKSQAVYAGVQYYYSSTCNFVSGAGITISRDVAEQLIATPVPQKSIEDDVHIALVLQATGVLPTAQGSRLDMFPSMDGPYVSDKRSAGLSLDAETLSKVYHVRFRSDDERDRDTLLHSCLAGLWERGAEPPLSAAQHRLASQFRAVCSTPEDISEHCAVLAAYARQCAHITEAGVRWGISSWALLQGLDWSTAANKTLISIDLSLTPSFQSIKEVSQQLGINYSFVVGNDLEVELQSTDLAFIDTWHVYGHLKRELARFAPLTRKFIILHDTTIDAIHGESVRNGWNIEEQARQHNLLPEEVARGLWPAVEEFLQSNPCWVLHMRLTNNNGLTVLKRVSDN